MDLRRGQLLTSREGNGKDRRTSVESLAVRESLMISYVLSVNVINKKEG
jgi:hypothetical protein